MIGLKDIREQLRWRAGRARGRNLRDTERYDRLCSTCMTLPTAKSCERWEKRRVKCEGKSERRDEGGRVTTWSSHQRLFCGFDPHWLANDGHFPHPSSFWRYSPTHHPRRCTCPSFCAPVGSTLGLFPFSHYHAKFTARVFHPYLFRMFTSKVSLFFIEVCYLHVPHHSTKLSLCEFR